MINIDTHVGIRIITQNTLFEMNRQLITIAC